MNDSHKIDLFLERKDPAYFDLLNMVRSMILESHIAMIEQLKWGIPCFKLKKQLFYIDVQKGKPLLAVMGGVNMPFKALLDFTNRKYVGHFFLDNMNDEKFEQLQMIIQTKIDLDLSA